MHLRKFSNQFLDIIMKNLGELNTEDRFASRQSSLLSEYLHLVIKTRITKKFSISPVLVGLIECCVKFRFVSSTIIVESQLSFYNYCGKIADRKHPHENVK